VGGVGASGLLGGRGCVAAAETAAAGWGKDLATGRFVAPAPDEDAAPCCGAATVEGAVAGAAAIRVGEAGGEDLV
jgi:hypothetical protein